MITDRLTIAAIFLAMAVPAAFPVALAAHEADSLRWSRTVMDGSRTGVTVPGSENTAVALGRVEGKTYYAPSRRVFRGGSVCRVAEAVIGAQNEMSVVKRVIGQVLPEERETKSRRCLNGATD